MGIRCPSDHPRLEHDLVRAKRLAISRAPLTSVDSVSGYWLDLGNHYFRVGDDIRLTGAYTGSFTVLETSLDLVRISLDLTGYAEGANVWIDKSYNGSGPDIGAVEK